MSVLSGNPSTRSTSAFWASLQAWHRCSPNAVVAFTKDASNAGFFTAPTLTPFGGAGPMKAVSGT